MEFQTGSESGVLQICQNLPGQFLEHGDGFIDDPLAGAGFGVTVETGPALVAAELVAFLVRNVTDPIVGQFRDISVAEGRTVFDVQAQLRDYSRRSASTASTNS